MHGEIEVQLVELCHAQTLERHKRLIEVGCLGHRMIPYLIDGLYVAVVFAEPNQEHISLIAVPLVAERHIVGVGEEIARSTLRKHFVRVGVECLPVGCGLPNSGAVAYGVVETGVTVAVAHVMEGVPYLVGYGGANRFAGRGIQPQCGNHKVIA